VRTSTLIVALGLALGCSGLLAQAQDAAKPENKGAAVTAQDTQSWNGDRHERIGALPLIGGPAITASY
jgi:hypothetical protein